MPKLPIERVYDGDILGEEIFVDDVFLFGKGTILTRKRIEILKGIDLKELEIEPRFKKFRSLEENISNLEQRFSYVKNNPFMLDIKAWLTDIIVNTGEYDDEKTD